jgi:hypothetical protein
MFQPYNSLDVTYLPVQSPTEAELEDPAAYANRVQRLLALELGVEASTISFVSKHKLS